MYSACPEPRKEGCPFKQCKANTHHAFWPGNVYKTAIEKTFRELPENKKQLCMYEHAQLHAVTEPPLKPTRNLMIQAIAESAIKQSGS